MTDKPKKKQLIKVESDFPNATGYEHTTMNFALVSSPATGRKQCTKAMSCREELNKAVSLKIDHSPTLLKIGNNAPVPVKNTSGKSNSPVDFEKLRLLIIKSVGTNYEDFKTKLFSGKALLNCYERKAGWDTSTITTVKHPYYKQVWLLTGPKEWMSQPQLLSVATFFIRLMSVHGPVETDTFEGAEKSLRKLYSNHMNKLNNRKEGEPYFNHYPDIESYLGHMDEIKLLVLNMDRIFKMSIEQAWEDNEKVGRGFGVKSGILSFFGDGPLNYNSNVDNARRTFAEVRKESSES